MNEASDTALLALGTIVMVLFFVGAVVAFEIAGVLFGGLAAMTWGAVVLGPLVSSD